MLFFANSFIMLSSFEHIVYYSSFIVYFISYYFLSKFFFFIYTWRYMDLSYTLMHHTTSNVDTCLADCATTHTILHYKKLFSNLSLVKTNVNIISGPVDLIQDSGRATIILPRGTKIHINDALYYAKSKWNLLSFKDIRRNGYHIETMNDDSNEYLLITSIIFGKKHVLEKLTSYSCRLYQTIIKPIESYAVMS